MESRVEVKTIRVNVTCEDCSKKPNSGCLLSFTGLVLASYPPQYMYVCPLCKRKYHLLHSYPYLEYREILND